MFQSSFFAHFMCLEVPTIVPPGGPVDRNKAGYEDDANDDDDLGIMDIDENDNKSGNYTLLSANILSVILSVVSSLIWFHFHLP